jgi:hemolysin activation/secretion protein
VRAFGFASGGDRPRRTNLGGSLGLRGYPLYGYIVGTKAWMLNQELRFPLFRHVTFGTAIGDIRFPENQAAIFLDLGYAGLPYEANRAVLGSYGFGFRWPMGPLAVIRLDLGWRFSSDNFHGYALSADDQRPFFLSVFFGYNY